MKSSTIITLIVAIVVILGATYVYMKHANLQPLYQATIQTPQYGSSSNSSQPTPNPTSRNEASTSTTAASVVSVDITNFAFNPGTITVKKGTTVMWTNKDSAPHTVTGINGGPSSPQLPQGVSYSYTFASTGTFLYHCAIHPSMLGKVVVTE